jgi:peptidoglycan/xylan/chitin deacetylase (PgdA/CDA1 family)
MRPDGELLCYIKLPLTEAATVRVRSEAAVLERLWQADRLRPHIPRLLHAGSWSGSYMLLQSPLQGQPGPTTITDLHETFLETLWSVQQIERAGHSLVDDIGTQWAGVAVHLDSTWESLGREVLRRSAEYLDRQTISCGISHGDFAPWNTRQNNKRLLVFDWESAQWSAPTSWDLFHFGLQTFASLNTPSPTNIPGDHNDGTYLLYLLRSVIQFYLEDNRAAMANRRQILTEALKRPVYTLQSTGDRPAQIPPVTLHSESARNGTVPSRPIQKTALKIVTTSWDDGDPNDLKIAELLHTRGLTGTFYIPMSGYLKKATLKPGDIRDLADAGFDIGAHSVSHESLTKYSNPYRIRKEVTDCKHTLEQIIGQSVPMFCYPNGRHDVTVRHEVRRAGYAGSRTTRMLSIRSRFSPYLMPTSLQAYPHRKSGYIRDLGRARDVEGLWRFTRELKDFQNWLALGRELFNRVLERGGVWHLYGHSWEIDELGLWDDLKKMLDYVAHREGVLYLTNSQLLSAVSR